MNPRIVKNVLYVALPVALLAAGYWIGQTAIKPRLQGPAVETVALAPVGDCDLEAGGCTLRSADGIEAHVEVTGRISPLRRFGLVLRTREEVEEIRVLLEMRGMEMNVRPISFEPAGDGAHEGSAILPACPAGRSDWEAQLRFRIGDRWYGGEIPFVVERD